MTMFKSDFPEAHDPAFVLAGGVASNHAIRTALRALGSREGFQTKIPPPRLCTDNAAMVAWAGVERGQLGLFDGLGTAPKARWPLNALTGGEGAGASKP
jgi:N6-L-threonylcarbamoyladenine synthase